MRALNLLREGLHERREAFDEGLTAAGFVVCASIQEPRATDAVLVWNRLARDAAIVHRFAAAGAAIIVAENGYVGARDSEKGKPLDGEGRKLFALALDHHAGAGRWPAGGVDRWRDQGIREGAWRADGESVLVLGQRGIGEPGIAMPRDWPGRTVQQIRQRTKRPVRVRPHPRLDVGGQGVGVSLEEDLSNAWCVVTWSSNAALRALCAGVPILSGFDRWIGAAAGASVTSVEQPLRCDEARRRVLERVGTAQWTLDEIRTGKPFRALLEMRVE